MKFFVRTLLTTLILFGAATAHSADHSVTADALAKFAPAYKSVETLRAQYIEQASSINDPLAMSKLQITMQQDMIEAIAQHGLSIDAYNRITRALANDEELRKALASLLQDSY